MRQWETKNKTEAYVFIYLFQEQKFLVKLIFALYKNFFADLFRFLNEYLFSL